MLVIVRSDTEEARCTKLIIDSFPPSRKTDLNESEDPRLVKSRTDKEQMDPRRERPWSATLEPMRVKERIDRVEPRRAKSNTDILTQQSAAPLTDS
mmetsp:Transcript_23214/g.59237  ORF Transcript_23214/g.59237 Transcript_23214/m.59237 type:complete len:96 (+) Transcript_23214:135-422(+)